MGNKYGSILIGGLNEKYDRNYLNRMVGLLEVRGVNSEDVISMILLWKFN